ncbi:class II lanthipeptide, LchA2/BrtA2 family [Clostridium sp. YIM B02505]|uniref:Class II lanthipeptide, LchA2/BrtA2 family n=1 Tax=Clostridium yunnanense TaxID=2800325 RepID=A0ABS1EWM3_9CLOT|nr:class II lanthipeptide, LchA2/BrtA2 family [Clostridium yunnanense]MBK1813748.1 class II lanthipeptide, LchA2/BrtA2 family [Clostridium yunnanense]
MENKYKLSTGYVSVEELEEISNEADVVGAFTTTLACAITGLTVIVVTEVACPSKACTGYCK